MENISITLVIFIKNCNIRAGFSWSLLAQNQKMDALFIKGMRIIKYLQIVITASILLLISGCIDLDNSTSSDLDDQSSSVNSEFYGVWKSLCDSGEDGTGSIQGPSSLGQTLDISSDTMISTYALYESEDCTGNVLAGNQSEYQIIYGEKIITPSGIEATELDTSTVANDGTGDLRVSFDLIYRNDSQLYLGTFGRNETRAFDINFDRYYTLQ